MRVGEKMLTTREAAAYMGLSEHTIRKYVERKLLFPNQRIGTCYLFLESECNRYLKTRRPRGNPAFSPKKTHGKRRVG